MGGYTSQDHFFTCEETMKTLIVYIHTGHCSVDNGAKYPLDYYSQLAAALGVPKKYGDYYGDDYLEIPEADWPTAKEILDENKMLYRVMPDASRAPHEWDNICNPELIAHFQRFAPAARAA